MTDDIPYFHISAVPGFNGVRVLGRVLALFSAMLLAGCSTVATYKSQTASGPAKPADYPVLVYTEDETVPRPCEVIGAVSIHAGDFTVFGGSVESEMKKMMQTAREKGADAVQVKSVEQPGFSSANYRMVADLLRYTDPWETVAITEQGFVNYLKTNQRNCDPIEGVWDGREGAPVRLGIMRNTSKPGRDFVGFILNTENPAWRRRYKKIDIKRGPQPGSYIFDYYFDDFSKQETTVILGRTMTFTLAVSTTDEETATITYSKSRFIP